MSIAAASFANLRRAHVILWVQTVDKTRRARLEELIREFGSIAELNEAMGMDRTDATFSQIRNMAVHSKSGKPRVMGDDLARRIEEKLKKPDGWMDTPAGYPDLSDQRISHAVKLMEAMPEWQRDQAIKILDTLAQPGANTGGNGTTG
jgi:hypothetical protein